MGEMFMPLGRQRGECLCVIGRVALTSTVGQPTITEDQASFSSVVLHAVASFVLLTVLSCKQQVVCLSLCTHTVEAQKRDGKQGFSTRTQHVRCQNLQAACQSAAVSAASLIVAR